MPQEINQPLTNIHFTGSRFYSICSGPKNKYKI